MNKVLKVNEVAERVGATVPYTREMLRTGILKGRKVGKEWVVDLEVVNEYLGIATNEEELKRELYIKELENRIRHLEFVLNAVKSNISNIGMML